MNRQDRRQGAGYAGLLVACALLLWGGVGPARAQSAFAPVAFVNNSVVTAFELQQRERLLLALRTPAVTRGGTLDVLIEDKLKLAAAAAAGVVPTEDELDQALVNFAARANLGPDEFLLALGDAGIDAESIHDYLRAQLAWGALVQGRFAARARVGEEEIDRALALSSGQGNARILVSEIVLPMTPQEAEISQQRAQELREITSFAEFEDAARRFSIGPTSASGGRLDWLPVSALPPSVGPIFLTMRPGEVTAPVPLEGSIALFQLRQLQDVPPPPSRNVQIDYALLRLPVGVDPRAEIARLKPRVDGCTGFFGENESAAPGQLLRESKPLGQIPSAVAQAVRNLDPGEMAPVPGGGGVVMLCSRSEAETDDEARDQLARRLFVQRLESFADGYLSELRAAAQIRIP